jgi:hypothetical protein
VPVRLLDAPLAREQRHQRELGRLGGGEDDAEDRGQGEDGSGAAGERQDGGGDRARR